MFEEYLLGEITLTQLIDWAIEQIEFKVREILRKEEIEL